MTRILYVFFRPAEKALQEVQVLERDDTGSFDIDQAEMMHRI